jgi:hypothetical protein
MSLTFERQLGATNPGWRRVDVLPQEQIQLGSMVLHVTHVVEQKLRETEVVLTEVTIDLVRCFDGQGGDGTAAFLAAVLQVSKHFIL